MNDYDLMLARKYMSEVVGIKGDYPNEVLLDMLIHSHKVLYNVNQRVLKAKKKFLGKFLLKYLDIV